jgi:hypothetical protein
MPVLLEDKNRNFKRLRHTPKEKAVLTKAGFQHVLSSNVSAIAKDKNNLVVRFHGGATYSYKGAGDLYRPMLQSNSKGKFVWSKLIRPKVPFKKVGSVKLQVDKEFTDRDLMDVAQTKEEVKQPLITSLISIQAIKNIGIITTPNVVGNIIATNAFL